MLKRVISEEFNKEIIKDILARTLLWFSGWRGSYRSWSDAESASLGYDSEKIVQAVEKAVEKVLNGEAAFERDSIAFQRIDYSWPLLGIILSLIIKNNRLRVLDFGGSLGSSYLQNRAFLKDIDDITWMVVEQSKFVKSGSKIYKNTDEPIYFFESIEEAIQYAPPDIIIFSSVLQYLEDPWEIIGQAYMAGIPELLVDITPFSTKKVDRICVQKVSPRIYPASYPCRIFSKEYFLKKMSEKWNLVTEFNPYINSYLGYRGFYFKRK